MMRVLLLGGSGQVGREAIDGAPPDATVIAPASSEVDLRSARSLGEIVRDTAPDVILNCAAFTRVDDAEAEPGDAFAINADAPRALAEAAVAGGARLLHVSTDYVFDGAGAAPFAPDAAVAPLSVYGASKLQGERHVLAVDPTAAIVRTAWVHAGRGVNFVATASRLLREGRAMRVVDDQVITPTRARHLAAALWTLAARPHVTGVLHFTDAGVASWYDVAECVLETLRGANAAGADAAVLPVDSSAYPRPARRPRVSLLDKHAGWDALGITPVHWRTGVAASTLELLHA